MGVKNGVSVRRMLKILSAALAAALLGGSFVLLCDVAARLLFASFEMPVGIVALLGGPFFLHLLLHRKKRRVCD